MDLLLGLLLELNCIGACKMWSLKRGGLPKEGVQQMPGLGSQVKGMCCIAQYSGSSFVDICSATNCLVSFSYVIYPEEVVHARNVIAFFVWAWPSGFTEAVPLGELLHE